MSFGGASADQAKDRRLSSLHIIGGYDINPTNTRTGVDLRVEGGALIKKSISVLGNIHVTDLIIGDATGNVYTDLIQESELGEGIDVLGNLMLDPDSVLNGNIETSTISEAVPGEGIKVDSNICIPKIVGDVFVCGNLTVIDNSLGASALKIDSVQVIGTQEASIASLTDSTSGIVSGTLGPITTIVDAGGNATSTSTQTAIDDLGNAIASINSKISTILNALRSHGLIAT